MLGSMGETRRGELGRFLPILAKSVWKEKIEQEGKN